MKKNIIKISLVIVLILLLAFLYYMFIYQGIKLKTVSYEVGSIINKDINYYLEKELDNTNNYFIDLSKIKNNEVGEYKYTIKHYLKTYSGIVKIVDTTAPTYTLMDSVIFDASSNDLKKMFIKLSDSSDEVNVSLKNENDKLKLKQPGEYEVSIIISDKYNNSVEETVKVKVVDPLSYKSIAQKDTELVEIPNIFNNFDNIFYKKLKSSVSPQNISYIKPDITDDNINKYIEKNYSGYKVDSHDVYYLTNKYGYITAIVLKVDISKDNSKKTIYLSEEMLNSVK